MICFICVGGMRLANDQLQLLFAARRAAGK